MLMIAACCLINPKVQTKQPPLGCQGAQSSRELAEILEQGCAVVLRRIAQKKQQNTVDGDVKHLLLGTTFGGIGFHGSMQHEPHVKWASTSVTREERHPHPINLAMPSVMEAVNVAARIALAQ